MVLTYLLGSGPPLMRGYGACLFASYSLFLLEAWSSLLAGSGPPLLRGMALVFFLVSPSSADGGNNFFFAWRDMVLTCWRGSALLFCGVWPCLLRRMALLCLAGERSFSATGVRHFCS